MDVSDIDPAYVPLIADDQDSDITAAPQRSRCRNVLLYSAVTIALIMSIAGAVYFLLPRHHSSSSDTVTIVNRYPDDISIFEISRDGNEQILAHLRPNDRVRISHERSNQCFVRHLENYVALEQINVHGATIVVGEGPDAIVPSRDGGQEQVVTFINDEEEPVTLSWVNFEGNTVDMMELEPKQQFDVKTYVDHVFAIFSAETHEIVGQFTVRPGVDIVRTRPTVNPQDIPLQVNVQNRTSGVVKLMWRDADGADHVVGVLEPNTDTVLSTYIGHEMYFLDSDGDETSSTIIVPSVTMLRAVEKSKQ